MPRHLPIRSVARAPRTEDGLLGMEESAASIAFRRNSLSSSLSWRSGGIRLLASRSAWPSFPNSVQSAALPDSSQNGVVTLHATRIFLLFLRTSQGSVPELRSSSGIASIRNLAVHGRSLGGHIRPSSIRKTRSATSSTRQSWVTIRIGQP